MLHESEMYLLKGENEQTLHWAETRMIRWMCNVKLRDKHHLVLSQQLGRENRKSGTKK